MLRLRPYKYSDAHYLISWMGDELSFTKWCADKFTYPLNLEKLKEYYHHYEKDDQGWLVTAVDEEGTPVGHLLMRKVNYAENSIHFGFIIVDPAVRGKGFGKEMLTLATQYAFDILKMRRITLCVFDNNPAAHACYFEVGFRDEKYNEECFPYKEEKWGRYDMAMVRGSYTIY